MADSDVSLAATGSIPKTAASTPLDLTSFGPKPITPQLPTQYKSPEGAFGIPQGKFETVGERKRAQKQALFGGIAATVKAGADYLQQKKTRQLTMDVERLMSAFSGLNEAKESGDEKAIAHNTAIINDITSDPKKAKLLAKAFDIPLLGGGKNAKENKAVLEAFKNYQANNKDGKSQLNPIAQQMQNQMPSRMGQSPEAAVRAQAIKDGLIPHADKQLEELTLSQKAHMQADTAEKKFTTAVDIAKMAYSTNDKKIKASIDAYLAKIAGTEEIARIHAAAQVKVGQERNAAILTKTKMITDTTKNIAEMNQQNKQLGLVAKQMDEDQKGIKTANDTYAKLSKQLEDNPGIFDTKKKGFDKTAAYNLKAAMITAQGDSKRYAEDFQQQQALLKLYTSMGGIKLPEAEAGEVQEPVTQEQLDNKEDIGDPKIETDKVDIDLSTPANTD